MEAIETVFIDRQEKPDLELWSFLLDHGSKIGLIVKDPEDNKKVHSSSYVYKADDLMKALEEYGGNLAFASDFPERLKQDILAVVTENKDNARRLSTQITWIYECYVLIQKTEKPEWNLVPQHILLVGRGNEAVGNAGNLLAVLGTPAYLNRVLMIDGKVGRCLAVFHHMGC